MKSHHPFFLGGQLLALLISSTQLQTACAGNFSDADWLALGSGVDNTVLALALSGNTLYAGGYFRHSGAGPVLNNIAQWNGTNWSALGSGVVEDASNPNAGAVTALAVLGNTLYVGGSFT